MLRSVAVLACLFAAAIAEGKDWTVFCMPHKHLDVGWNRLPHDALQGGYPGSVEDFENVGAWRALFVRNLTRAFPLEARFKWNFDATWQIEQIEKFLPGRVDEVRQLVNEGEFSYSPTYANLHTLYLTNEQLLRMTAYGRRLENQGFRRSTSAIQSDVPTVGWGTASALSQSGIKYLLKATNYRSRYSRNMYMPLGGPLFRWTGPDGSKILCFYHDHYAAMVGNDGEARPPESVLEARLLRQVEVYEKLSAAGQYPFDAFPLFGSEGDWGLTDRSHSDFVRSWNKKHPHVQLRMSTVEEFFEYIESRFAGQAPQDISGGWGVSYDLVEGNAAKSGAQARRNDHWLAAGESLAALAASRFGRTYPAEAFFQAWQKQVLYHEHSFGMRDGPGSEGRRMYAWKAGLAEQAGAAARRALDDALAAIAAEIANQGENRVAVFNTHSFPVSGIAETRVEGELAKGPVAILDVQTGRPALSEREPVTGGVLVRFRADDVPGLGYRSFRVERAAAEAPPAAALESSTLQNEFFRLVLAADGTMASLLDRRTGRELIDSKSPYRGNQFVFMNHTWQPASPRNAVIRSVPRGSLGMTLEVKSEPTAIFPALATRYTLYSGLNRLEIENSFTKAPGKSGSNETLFYAFPFAVPQQRFCLDLPGVVARYPDDFRPETDWTIMPAQSFAAVSNSEMAAVLATCEAPNFQFSAMRKFFDHPTQPDLSASTLFAQPLTKQSVNGDDYDLDGGTYTFRYAVASQPGALAVDEAVRFAAAFQRGLFTVALPSRTGPLPPEGRLATIDSRQAIVSALKRAEDGRGLIVRLWNPTDQPTSARIAFPHRPVSAANLTDALERDLRQALSIDGGGFSISCGPKAFVTVRAQCAPP